MMQKFSDAFIREIPKTDLHLHLDGSLRLSTLIQMAKDRKVQLPSFTEEGMNELVFKSSYKNLDEYLTGFAWTGQVLQDAEALAQAARELALDNFAEGVRYCEVRFAPQLHMRRGFSFEQVMAAVDDGLRKARAEINAAIPADDPPFEYGIIVCAMRFFTRQFSPYYRDFCATHAYSSPLEITQLASLELARATVKLREETAIQVVGLDLAGSEHGNPASAHQAAYTYITKNFLPRTVHAGEAYGPESIFQAITDLHADRIGHGLHLFNAGLIRSDPPRGKAAYVENLVNAIAEKRVTIEVCLTSNMQTSPGIGDIRTHSFSRMLEHHLSVTLCTDNRLVSHTDICSEYRLALDNFAIGPRTLKDIIAYGFKRSFYYHSYREKRAYVRRVLDYYERLEKKHGIKI